MLAKQKQNQFLVYAAAALLVVSLAFSLKFVNNNLSEHPTTQFLLNQIFTKAQAAETYPEPARLAEASGVAQAERDEYQATIIEQSNYIVNLLPEKGYTISVKFLNTGSRAWNSNSYFLKTTHNPSLFRHSFWINGDTPVKGSTSVAPGETITLKFALQAPPTTGLYIERFALTIGSGTLVNGSMFELPINITLNPNAKAPKPPKTVIKTTPVNNQGSPTPNTAPTPSTSSDASASSSPTVAGVTTANIIKQLNIIEKEPEIKVGLYFADNKIVPITADGEFAVFVDGIKQGNYGAGTIVKVQYIGGVYNLILPSGTASFYSNLTFKPVKPNTILELPEYERRVSWNQNINDNRFQGNIEIKHNPITDRLWTINTLPLEQYVAGIAEVSNIAVPEFHKALAVAARTYALRHLLDNTKYSGFFHVHDNNDQVYRGYNATRRLPLYVEGAKATIGQVVTLNDEIVTTPYFTQSSGQTKSYESVWGKTGIETSHLLSVSVPQDVGRSLLGHGVGMSAQGAKRMAELDDLDYQTILKHFYTGVDISKVY